MGILRYPSASFTFNNADPSASLSAIAIRTRTLLLFRKTNLERLRNKRLSSARRRKVATQMHTDFAFGSGRSHRLLSSKAHILLTHHTQRSLIYQRAKHLNVKLAERSTLTAYAFRANTTAQRFYGQYITEEF